MLLSAVNMKLRDQYVSPMRSAMISYLAGGYREKLAEIGYEYNRENRLFDFCLMR